VTPSIAVVGTGLAGLSATLALAELGVATHLIGPAQRQEAAGRDTRSTALFGSSLDFLQRIGVLTRLGDRPVPLLGLRLIDATGGLFRAPEILFESEEIGRSFFGMNIENAPLLEAMAKLACAGPLIQWHDTMVDTIAIYESAASIRTGTGEVLEVQLVIGADGERSVCREIAGVGHRSWSYPQVAIASGFQHTRPHNNISTELHRRSGPLTTVPLNGNASSLVWVERPDMVEGLLALDDKAFAASLDAALEGVLGTVTAVRPRTSFALSGITADKLGARRVALVGEAAHRLPPIGAQGFNLGLRDAAWLGQLVADTMRDGGDPGATQLLDAYERARRSDVASRTAVVDALNRSLIADALAADLLRGAGLVALKSVGPLRRFFMREGMGPGGELPRLMRPVE